MIGRTEYYVSQHMQASYVTHVHCGTVMIVGYFTSVQISGHKRVVSPVLFVAIL